MRGAHRTNARRERHRCKLKRILIPLRAICWRCDLRIRHWMFLMLTWGHQGIRSNSTGGARPFDRHSGPLVLVLRRYFLAYQLPHLEAIRHPVVADIQSYERIRHKSVSRLRVACEIAAISRLKTVHDRYVPKRTKEAYY